MANIKIFFALIRIDNWTKNLLMLVGSGLAFVLTDSESAAWVKPAAMAMASLCMASSANYILNGWTDARSDSNHPLKKARATAQYPLNAWFIFLCYAVFALAALALAWGVHPRLADTIAIYLFCAWLYNVPPLHFKDIAYLDTLTESVNYPLRILIGWLAVMPGYFPPSSIVLLGWATGGFTMSVKRLAEYQMFSTAAEAVAYRKSYGVYTVKRLVCACLFYALIAAFSSAVFLIKYHVELMLAFPFISLWFVWYMALGMDKNENTIYPERLFREKKLLWYSLLVAALIVFLSNADIPSLHTFGEPLAFK